eukprot:763461-Hanusia_phi.AAC.6
MYRTNSNEQDYNYRQAARRNQEIPKPFLSVFPLVHPTLKIIHIRWKATGRIRYDMKHGCCQHADVSCLLTSSRGDHLSARGFNPWVGWAREIPYDERDGGTRSANVRFFCRRVRLPVTSLTRQGDQGQPRSPLNGS